ncbi:DUF2993 domain-containing protein [uncultured Jatrophihabitans sp.]|uniref:LmeA family phospholipid-binding protein n=1 Tax=uncultured Jatrophihabitans sp. TaxID=1610747 RepID=UPI0035C97285
MSAWQGAPPAYARRRRHTGRTLLIVFVVIVGLLIAADRIGLYIAERTAADTIQSSQHLPSRPDVDIAGFPFLTQLATGKSDKITVTAQNVPIDKSAKVLTLSRVQVVLHQVTASRSFDHFHADTADAQATITYAELSNALGIDVSYAGDGRIRAAKTITVLGQSVQAAISTEPRLVNGALGFGKTSINGLDRLSGDIATALDKIFDLHIPLKGIPFGVRVQSLHMDSVGAQIGLTGSDLSFDTKKS